MVESVATHKAPPRWLHSRGHGTGGLAPMHEQRTCDVDGCKRSYYGQGWCRLHYDRWRRSGTPALTRLFGEDAFWSRVAEVGGCWEWTGARTRGYGRVQFGGVMQPAHRVAYELVVGKVPDGLQLDHLCRNRACVNPAHLEPVTCRENLRRGINHNAVKTHCPKGHPYDEKNTTRNSVTGGRLCLACKREWMRVYNARKRLEAAA